MGVDTALLIMDLEDRFGITILDGTAERICTVGDLYLHILERVRRNRPIRCPTSRAFYQLRRTLTRELGVDRPRVRPATLLRDLFPADSRAILWPRLASALGLPDLPDPDPPLRGPTMSTFRKALLWTTVGIWRFNLLMPLLLGPPVAVAAMLQLWFLLWILAVVGVSIILAAFWLDARSRRSLPTVRDLVGRLAMQDFHRYLEADWSEPAPATIWAELVALLSAHTGKTADEIHPDDRFSALL
jgi:hypothetical protein